MSTQYQTSPEEGMDGLDNTAFQEENRTTVAPVAEQRSSPKSSRSSVSNGTETRPPPGGAKLSSPEETPIFQDEHRQRATVSIDEESLSASDAQDQRGMVNFAFESEEERDSDKSTVNSDETEVAEKESVEREGNHFFPEDNELDKKYLANGNGQVLNQNGHTEITIPDDALINFNTGRVRAKRKPKSRESPTEEKIPLEYIEKDLSPFTEYNEKAQEAHDNFKETNLQNHDHKEEGIPMNSPVTSEKQTNGTGKPFEEYFIPTNTHKKFLRGEKLYLAQNTRKSKPSWKRIILCGFITIIIVIAILAGILAATGILMSESQYSHGTEPPKDGPLPSRSSGSSDVSDEYAFPPPPQNSPHSGLIPPSLLNSSQSNNTLVSASTTTQEARTLVSPSSGIRQTNESVLPTITVFLNHSTVPVRIVPNAVRGEFTILDLEFVDALKDNTSREFVSLATELEVELKKIFSKKGNDPYSVKITSFRPGSVVVRFTATWNTPQPALSASVTKTVIQRYLEVKNESLAGHHINILSVKTEVISDTRSPSAVWSTTYVSLEETTFPTTAVSTSSSENVSTPVRTEEVTSGGHSSVFLDSEATFRQDVSHNPFDTTTANPATMNNQSTTMERTTTPEVSVSGNGTVVYYPRKNVNILQKFNDSSFNSTSTFLTESSSEFDGTEFSSVVSPPSSTVEDNHTVINKKEMKWNSDDEFESPWEALGFFSQHSTDSTTERKGVGGVETYNTSTELSHSEPSMVLDLFPGSVVVQETETSFTHTDSGTAEPQIETSSAASRNFTSSSKGDDGQSLEVSIETQIPEHSTNVSESLENAEEYSSSLAGTSENPVLDESTSREAFDTTSRVTYGSDIPAYHTTFGVSDEQLTDDTDNYSVHEVVDSEETNKESLTTEYSEVNEPIGIHSSTEVSIIQIDPRTLTTAFPSNDSIWSEPIEPLVSEHQTENGLQFTKFKTVTSFDENQGKTQSNEPEETTDVVEDPSNNRGISITTVSLTTVQNNLSSFDDGTTDNMLEIRNLQFRNLVTKNESLDEWPDDDVLQNDTSTNISVTTTNTNTLLTSLGLSNETQHITVSTITESTVQWLPQNGEVSRTDNGVREMNVPTILTSNFNITETFFEDFVFGTQSTLEANVTKPTPEEVYATTNFEEDDKINQDAETVKDFSSEGTNSPKYSDVEIDQRTNMYEADIFSGVSANITTLEDISMNTEVHGVLDELTEYSGTQVASSGQSLENSTRMERQEGGVATLVSSQNNTPITEEASNSSEEYQTLKNSDTSGVTNLIATTLINSTTGATENATLISSLSSVYSTLPLLPEDATLDQLEEDKIIFVNKTSTFPRADQSDLFHFNEGKPKDGINTNSSGSDGTFLVSSEEMTNEPDFNEESTFSSEISTSTSDLGENFTNLYGLTEPFTVNSENFINGSTSNKTEVFTNSSMVNEYFRNIYEFNKNVVSNDKNTTKTFEFNDPSLINNKKFTDSSDFNETFADSLVFNQTSIFNNGNSTDSSNFNETITDSPFLNQTSVSNNGNSTDSSEFNETITDSLVFNQTGVSNNGNSTDSYGLNEYSVLNRENVTQSFIISETYVYDGDNFTASPDISETSVYDGDNFTASPDISETYVYDGDNFTASPDISETYVYINDNFTDFNESVPLHSRNLTSSSGFNDTFVTDNVGFTYPSNLSDVLGSNSENSTDLFGLYEQNVTTPEFSGKQWSNFSLDTPDNRIMTVLNESLDLGDWKETMTSRTGKEQGCAIGEFTCDGEHKCRSATQICDGFVDCADGSDESTCEDSCGSNFRCDNFTCISKTAHCDGIWDCVNGTDETDCVPNECGQHEVMCLDGSTCIKPLDICDGNYNCHDRSDEVGCVDRTTCDQRGRFFCSDGLCIPSSLKCDGSRDCKSGEDEANCTCANNEFQCMDGYCVSGFARCDGHQDCNDGSDEIECLRVDTNGVVQVYNSVAEQWTLVCGVKWTLQDGHQLCQELGFSVAKMVDTRLVITNSSTWAFHSNSNHALWTYGLKFNSTCEGNRTAVVNCLRFNCSTLPGPLYRKKRVVDGQPSLPEQWPSLAMVQNIYTGKTCHAEIVSPVWLVTSADCVQQPPENGSDWIVYTSLEKMRGGAEEFQHKREIRRIVVHPHSSKFRSAFLRDYDVALVQLAVPLHFDQHIGAICLPEEEVRPGIACFSGAFGNTKPRAPWSEPTTISYLALVVLDRDKCNEEQHYGGSVNSRMLCTRTSESRRGLCDNDEGAPLMCLSTKGTWHLGGVLTYQRWCNIYQQQPAIFANIFSMREYIEKIIGSKNYWVPYDSKMYSFLTTTEAPKTTQVIIETTTAITSTVPEEEENETSPLLSEKMIDGNHSIIIFSDQKDNFYLNNTVVSQEVSSTESKIDTDDVPLGIRGDIEKGHTFSSFHEEENNDTIKHELENYVLLPLLDSTDKNDTNSSDFINIIKSTTLSSTALPSSSNAPVIGRPLILPTPKEISRITSTPAPEEQIDNDTMLTTVDLENVTEQLKNHSLLTTVLWEERTQHTNGNDTLGNLENTTVSDTIKSIKSRVENIFHDVDTLRDAPGVLEGRQVEQSSEVDSTDRRITAVLDTRVADTAEAAVGGDKSGAENVIGMSRDSEVFTNIDFITVMTSSNENLTSDNEKYGFSTIGSPVDAVVMREVVEDSVSNSSEMLNHTKESEYFQPLAGNETNVQKNVHLPHSNKSMHKYSKEMTIPLSTSDSSVSNWIRSGTYPKTEMILTTTDSMLEYNNDSSVPIKSESGNRNSVIESVRWWTNETNLNSESPQEFQITTGDSGHDLITKRLLITASNNTGDSTLSTTENLEKNFTANKITNNYSISYLDKETAVPLNVKEVQQFDPVNKELEIINIGTSSLATENTLDTVQKKATLLQKGLNHQIINKMENQEDILQEKGSLIMNHGDDELGILLSTEEDGDSTDDTSRTRHQNEYGNISMFHNNKEEKSELELNEFRKLNNSTLIEEPDVNVSSSTEKNVVKTEIGTTFTSTDTEQMQPEPEDLSKSRLSVESVESEDIVVSSSASPISTSVENLEEELAGMEGVSFHNLSKYPSSLELCEPLEFRCGNVTTAFRACVPLSQRCDSVINCADGSDEDDCENGCQRNYQCENGKCLARHQVCDRVKDCSHSEDEADCDMWKCLDEEFSCGNGRCIPEKWHCDGVDNCGDNTDEAGCVTTCSEQQFFCPEGWCIPETWKCNGVLDCRGGEDERSCDCSDEEFKCQSGGCIEKQQVCNRNHDCPDSSDELHCIKLHEDSMLLEVFDSLHGWRNVCADNWDELHSNHVCQNLGYSEAVLTEYPPGDDLSPEASRGLYHLVEKPHASNNKTDILELLSLRKDITCQSGGSVAISCREFQCGAWSLAGELQGRIIGGSSAPDGQWPSVGLVVNKNDNYTVCTVSVLSPRWLVTSASCVEHSNLSVWEFVGSMHLTSTDKQSYLVKRTVFHPNFKHTGSFSNFDIVLLELETAVPFDHYTGAICLPEKNIQPRQLCVSADWNRKKDQGTPLHMYLQYLPIPTMAADECNGSRHYNGQLPSTSICAGFIDREESVCQENSGAPVMCINDDDRWELHGTLTSYRNCGHSGHPAIYTSVSAVSTWIKSIIGSGISPDL